MCIAKQKQPISNKRKEDLFTNYKEVRKIRAGKLRNLCIEKNWYTRGTNEEYGHRYQMERKGYTVGKIGMHEYWMDGDQVVEEVLNGELGGDDCD